MAHSRLYAAVTSLALPLLLAAAAGRSQEESPGPRQSEPTSLIITAGHTDSKMMEDGAFLKIYSGGVHAVTRNRDSEVTADVAQYDSRIGEGRFYGSAAFRDSSRYLNADTLIYLDKESIVRAIGNVSVTEKDRSFWAQEVIYHRKERLVLAKGSVIVREDSLKASITGGQAVFNDSTGSGMVSLHPVLVREDEEGEIITVTCDDTLEVLKAEKIIRLWKNVVITQDSLTAKSGHALYEGKTELFTLTGSPEASQIMEDTRSSEGITLRAENVVKGDTIRVQLHERRVTGVDVVGGAKNVTVWRDSTNALHSRSILESADMKLVMADRLISQITAGGRARSYFLQNPTGDTDMFVNDATGDTLRFFFVDGRIDHLRISGYGGAGAKGKYYEYAPIDTLKMQDRERAAGKTGETKKTFSSDNRENTRSGQ